MSARAVPVLLRRSEHDEQRDLFAWAALKAITLRELALLFAVPNFAGRLGKLTAIHGAKLKAEGRKAGVPDIVLPVARGGFHGLFIEMKRVGAPPSETRPEQHEWHRALKAQGYFVAVCYGFESARTLLLSYLDF